VDISLFDYKKGLVTIFLLIYVDDIIVANSSSSAVDDLLHTLKGNFALKDLGPLHYFLGLEVSHSDDGIHLSQKKCTVNILHCVGMSTCKPAPTPLPCSTKISAQVGIVLSVEDATKYIRIVGVLQYLTLTRLDISFVVNKVF
jgi:hypothetical protein